MKRFRDTEAWKWIKTGLEIAVIVLAIIAIVIACRSLGISEAFADWEDEDYEVAYAICAKDDHVNIRMFPNKKQDPIGFLDPGDEVWLDGRKKNGFVHCVGLGIEGGEGWVYAGYLVGDKPVAMNRSATIVSKGRLAARKCVDGKRTRWLKPLASVKVYFWSDEWCVTNCGYVRSEYLELDGE